MICFLPGRYGAFGGADGCLFCVAIFIEQHRTITAAADLLPDGNGKKTPSVTELKIKYKEVPSPLPPFELSAYAGDGEVTLSWPYSVDETVGGYYIFYGDRPGEYLGREAVEGTSPVDAGSVTSVTLTGLKNGKIYYFSVASYSRFDSRIMGELSKETYARPKRK